MHRPSHPPFPIQALRTGARRLALLLLLPGLALAQSSGGPYTLRKQVVASGGALATAGPYRVVGTAGQVAAAVASGGSYRLQGGFHAPAARPDALHCDSFEDTPCP